MGRGNNADEILYGDTGPRGQAFAERELTEQSINGRELVLMQLLDECSDKGPAYLREKLNASFEDRDEQVSIFRKLRERGWIERNWPATLTLQGQQALAADAEAYPQRFFRERDCDLCSGTGQVL